MDTLTCPATTLFKCTIRAFIRLARLYYGSLVLDEQELSKIQWPVLGIFGDQDDSIPVENVTKFEQALNFTGIPNEIYIYEGVGHAFANPSGDNYAPEQTADAWNKTLAFLENHV